MAGTSAGERTEKATPKKKRDERKKGNVFQSKDVRSLVTILVSFIMLNAAFGIMYRNVSTTFIKYMANIGSVDNFDNATIVQAFKDIFTTLVGSIGLIIVPIMIVSILSSGVQTRFIVSKENIKFKFSNINPLSGIKRMFSLKSVVEVIKSLFKITVLGYFIYTTIKINLNYIPKLISVDIIQGVGFIGDTVMRMVFSIAAAFVVIAGFDFAFSLYQYNKKLMMTKHEVKEEYKEMEGDPKIKGKRRQIQQQLAMNRMMAEVVNADVIIRNPTHYAIAVRYDIDKDRAPIVLAKGKDHLAFKIIDIAESNKIHTVENKPLARALYKDVEVNRMIPKEYFEPVAEILAWVYKTNNKGKK